MLGMHRQKQYLVKYQGLAHAHNHWVAETQLLIDAPLLIANYNHKNQVRIISLKIFIFFFLLFIFSANLSKWIIICQTHAKNDIHLA